MSDNIYYVILLLNDLCGLFPIDTCNTFCDSSAGHVCSEPRHVGVVVPYRDPANQDRGTSALNPDVPLLALSCNSCVGRDDPDVPLPEATTACMAISKFLNAQF